MTTMKSTVFGSGITILSTELNSLANNANTVASTAIDNTTNRNLYIALGLLLPSIGTARAAPLVTVYRMLSLDAGTTYPDVDETTATPVATFVPKASTAASRPDPVTSIELPPGFIKFFIRQSTAQALAASGNLLMGYAYSLES